MEESLLQEIRSQFGECNICMSDYDDDKCVPMLLRCQHSMCQACVSNNRHGNLIVCPFCKVEFNITKTQIKETAIEKDRTRISLLELLQVLKCKVNRCCECSSKLSIFSCEKCAYYVCDKCKQSHQDNCDLRKAFRRTVSGNCMKQNHDYSRFKYYCSTCKVSLCATCAFEDHRGEIHDVRDLFIQYKSCMLEIRNKLYSLKEKVTATEEIRHRLKIAANDVMKTRREVDNIVDRNDVLSKKEKEDYKKQAQDYERRILQELKSWRKKCSEYSENAMECCKVAKSIQQDVPQLLSKEDFIKQKLGEFCETKLQHELSEIHYLEKLTQLKFEVQKPKEKKGSFASSLIAKFSALRMKIQRKMDHINALEDGDGKVNNGVIIPLVLLLLLFTTPTENKTPSMVTPVGFQRNALRRGCVQNQRFSTEPFDTGTQICGEKNNLYKYKGAFVNKTYSFLKNQCLSFGVEILPREILVRDVQGVHVMVEFGVSTGSAHSKFLSDPANKETLSWNIVINKFGNMFIVNNHGPLNNFASKYNLIGKFEMCFYKNKKIKIRDIDRNATVDSVIVDNVKRSTNFLPVFALYAVIEYRARVSLVSQDVSFNESTVHSAIFVSSNRRSIDTHKFVHSESDIKMAFVYTDYINCTKEECYLPIDVSLDATDSNFFSEIGFLERNAQQKHKDKNIHHPLLSIVSCSSVKRWWLFSNTCLINHSSHKRERDVMDEIWSSSKLEFYISRSLGIIHVKESFGFDVSFTFDKKLFKRPLQFYIRAPENESISFKLGDDRSTQLQSMRDIVSWIIRNSLGLTILLIELLNFIFGKFLTREENQQEIRRREKRTRRRKHR